jgi:hypothetical protein
VGGVDSKEVSSGSTTPGGWILKDPVKRGGGIIGYLRYGLKLTRVGRADSRSDFQIQIRIQNGNRRQPSTGGSQGDRFQKKVSRR